MNVTDEFFTSVLVPLSNVLREKERTLFPMHPDPNLATYYQMPRRGRFESRDFETNATDSPDEFVNCLVDLWRQEGFIEGVEMKESLLGLARHAAEKASVTDTEDDISPFLYAMF